MPVLDRGRERECRERWERESGERECVTGERERARTCDDKAVVTVRERVCVRE